MKCWLIAIAAPVFSFFMINDTATGNSAYSGGSNGSSYSSSGGWSGGGSHK